jgi:hypothetical protein
MAAQRERIVTRPSRDRLSARESQLVGLTGFVLAATLPPVFWHRPFAAIASDFRLDLEYLVTGWTGYILIALGLLFLVPVVLSIGRHPESRYYPRSRNAYAAWGITLYLLGIALASQVAAVTNVHPVP